MSDGAESSIESEEEEQSDEKLDIWGDDDDDDDKEIEKDKNEKKEDKKITKNQENDKKKKKENIFNSKTKNYREKIELKILYIQMELCGNKTLRDAIDNNLLNADDIKWKYISQLLEAIQYVHARGCIHRDLKQKKK